MSLIQPFARADWPLGNPRFNAYVACEVAGFDRNLFGKNDCSEVNCHTDATCVDMGRQRFECHCNQGFHGDGNHCEPWVAVNECENGENDCDLQAGCHNIIYMSYH